MSDMIREYRTIDIHCDRANDMIPPIFASTGDDNGRILRVVLTDNGENVDPSEKLHAQLLINPSPYDSGSIGDLVDMTPVDGETATFEVGIPAGAVSKPGLKRMGVAFLLDNDDGSQDIVCSRPFTVNVEQGVLRIESDSAIGAFESAVRQAVASAQAAKASETNASDSAAVAERNASAASLSADSAKASETNAANSETNAKTSETAAKTSETNASQSANDAQLSASAAASSAQEASASAESAQMASDSATSAEASAAQSASEASTSAESAKTSETAAASSASAAATSEANAASSATVAREAVDGFGLEIGKTITGNPGTDAVVDIAKQGTKYVANFTIPRGDAGANGINDNVPIGTISGVVAQATDAYPALPRKVQVHGRTIENLWPIQKGTVAGITISTDDSGLISFSGTSTATDARSIEFDIDHSFAVGEKYTLFANNIPTGIRLIGIRFYNQNSMVKTFTTTSYEAYSIMVPDIEFDRVTSLIGLPTSTTNNGVVNGPMRVMLVEGDAVPVVFAPSGVNTVEPTKLVAAGKNLASVTTNSNNPNLLISDVLPPGNYVFSAVGDVLERGYNLRANSMSGYDIANGKFSQTTEFSLREYASVFLNLFNSGNIENIQIEKGASVTQFEQPVKIETNLPSDISLADGDTLTIDRNGTTQILHSEGEPTVLDNVTLPELPAPTFNVYTTGGYIPPTVDVDYEQDVNLVLQSLEAKIAALEINQATN